MPRSPTTDRSDGTFITHTQCPCGASKDALAVYQDGEGVFYGHCFRMGCDKHFPRLEGYNPPTEEGDVENEAETVDGLLSGEFSALNARRISLPTVQRYNYTVGKMGSKPVQIANYYNPKTGAVCAQKVRDANKGFKFLGDTKSAGFFGQQLWGQAGKRVVVTEGEIDAMSIAQVMDLRWPVVSVKNGASGAAKQVAEQLEWLMKFDEVVFAFDNDDAGQKAALACVTILPPGKGFIARFPEPYKDASDMLQAGDVKGLTQVIWQAELYRPDGIVSISDLMDEVLNGVPEGLPWCLPSITKATYGRHMGECVGVGAGTGVGKTDFITQQIAFDLTVLKEPVAAFFLEQSPAETVRRIAGKVGQKTFHLPDTGWAQEDLVGSLDQLKDQQLYLYNHFGATDWEVIKERIRYLAHSSGVRLFYLDHLTALAAAEDDERVALERIMAEVSSLCQELRIWLLFVSHLATPDGKPHEEGGRVMIRHFKGSRAIGFWAHNLIGIERDQQAEDPEARQTTFYRVLKCRLNGSATGTVIPASYDAVTGILNELSNADGDLAPF